MQPAKLNVTLISMTADAISVVFAAYQQCYKDGFVGDDWEEYARSADTAEGRKKQGDFVNAVLASGHDSPIEHVTFNFAISGISRACSHQIVRHRIASYSQQSQRYVDMANASVIIPPAIAQNEKAAGLYMNYMQTSANVYGAIVAALMEDGADQKKAQEDARFVLTNAAETRLVASFNCRSLINFFDLRCCQRAQWEIRKLADAMLSLVRVMLPEVFAHTGPRCDRLGYCPEAPRFSCGKRPTLKQLVG